ncbi:transferase [Roseibium sp. TrichSKD4]|uniref:KdsC family phosphatase n=1 Tax=Roseibium sp. TrichSKD4 TaxID=744980 RepID=UPI0001E57781|nr:HAD hydrolase family protein [Roseibium sp. TrichSKD4]EFO29536.1 transferase [Roseibium sp. TrichSKD4]
MGDATDGSALHGTVKYRALITDFDGVHTDNSVFLDQDGREFVRCSRADGLGIEMLRARGLRLMILSREENPVVAARARKLKMDVLHNIKEKLPVLDEWRLGEGLEWSEIVYIGDDVNDLECIKACGLGVAPKNGHPDVLSAADLCLDKKGGDGALRELCDYLIKNDLKA